MLKQVEAGVLRVAYEESGAPDGRPVVLLHGFPYDVRAYDDVAPRLAEAGCRVIVPYLRGYGPTRFLSADGVVGRVGRLTVRERRRDVDRDPNAADEVRHVETRRALREPQVHERIERDALVRLAAQDVPLDQRPGDQCLLQL